LWIGQGPPAQMIILEYTLWFALLTESLKVITISLSKCHVVDTVLFRNHH
jgi:hypothetical protein